MFIMTRNPEILFLCEYVKDSLYFATVRQGKVLKSTPDTHYFSIDNELVYENYYSDFGPLNLGCVYKYCKLLNEKLVQCLNKQLIVHYTQTNIEKKTNAAFLLGCYGVLYLNLSPRDALKPLLISGQIYKPFQDPVQGESIYTINLLECFMAIKKARDLGFFNFTDFNYDEYNSLNQIHGGDINWIVPNKFLAFLGPIDNGSSLYHSPKIYLKYFITNNVRIVIRLNKKQYDSSVFSNVGIFHYDLFFPDGSNPPRHILCKFLQISEEADCAIGVHCKAGLGRTGSLIGCYLIKHYRMTAHEAIAWMRICRPGSVIGHQQEWLEKLETWLMKQGNNYRKRKYQDINRLPTHEFGVYSIAQKSLMPKSVILRKISSPSPPMQRSNRSDLIRDPVIRPQASRVREVPSKSVEKEQSKYCIKMISAHSQTSEHRCFSGASSRTSGAGEPRSPRPSACPNHVVSQRNNNSASSYNSQTRPIVRQYHPVPTFRTTQGPLIKTINDARNFLLNSTFDKTDNKYKSPIPVTPQYAYHMNRSGSNTPGCSKPVKQSLYCQDATPITMQQNRRRLGRSPSPIPIRLIDRSRATNTTPREKFIPRNPSKTTIKEELSRLKNASPRRGSVGAASVGAGSLGASRDAPAPKRAPSVRSDERPTATQGDMLNSIKFQRRFRDTLHIDKIKSTINEKPSLTMEKDSSKQINMKSSTESKQGVKCPVNSREKITSKTSKGFFSPPRPSSPTRKRPGFY